MQKLTFSTHIRASKNRVWHVLWDDASYRQWTAAFHEGSYAESDWQEGSKILFLGSGGDGMVSRIARLVPNEFMSFQHLGEMKGGVEDFSSAEAQGWAGAHENYTLRENGGGTELSVELDVENSFAEYFVGAFPKALARVKELAEAQSIMPFLWFDHRIEEALNLYTSALPNSKIVNLVRNGDTVFTADFSLCGQRFAALNGHPAIPFNPAISFYIVCETETEIDNIWEKLSEGGMVMMPLQQYPWSAKYGWLQDRYGLTWQLGLGKFEEVGQKITPSLLFVGQQHGRAGDALQTYSSIFKNAYTDGILLYGDGDPGGAAGTVQHAQFSLDGCKFMVMDNSGPHEFQFNEAVSFVISCETQEEVDYYWEKLIADGGQAGQCAWLKDKFGVSWQVVPPALVKYLNDPDPEKANRVMQAMLKMSKIVIADLERAYTG